MQSDSMRTSTGVRVWSLAIFKSMAPLPLSPLWVAVSRLCWFRCEPLSSEAVSLPVSVSLPAAPHRTAPHRIRIDRNHAYLCLQQAWRPHG